MTARFAFAALPFALLTITCPAEPEDGKYPPPLPPEGKWEALFSGKLADQWTGMSLAIDAPILKTQPNADRPGEYVLHIDHGPTGLIRSMKAYENYILEYEWRHLTEAPSAGGGKGTSGNAGIIIGHGPFPRPGSPWPNEGHEIQVCNLGNGSWYTSHGDTFTLPGSISTAIPDPRFGVSHDCGHRSMPIAFRGSKTGEWNRVRITTMDGVIQNEVNGHLASTLYRATPRKGYISIESEGAPVEFRNMRLQELTPDPDLAPKHIAPLLPEPMTTSILKPGAAVELPDGDCTLMIDSPEKRKLDALLTGWELPATEVSGRVLITARGGKVTVTADGKEVVPAKPLTGGKGSLHLESGKFGHVLLLRPAGR